MIEAFRVGTMTLTWDGQIEALVVEAHEIRDDASQDDQDEDDDEEQDDEAPDLLQVRLSAPAARGFIAHAAEVVAAGRLPCPLCGLPLNPEGHICPRKNGLHALTWMAQQVRTAPVRGSRSRTPVPDLGPWSTDDEALTTEFDRAQTIDLLTEGEIEIVGRLVEASNLNLYCTVTRRCPDPEPDIVAACVYKPIRGERPLDDFPDGTLAFREVAAYRVSEAIGWNIVPPTVLRDGPLGPGMVQLWIDVDEQSIRSRPLRRGDPALRRMAAVRRGDQQRGPQGRPHAAGRGRACLRRRPRGLLFAGPQAADDPLGLAGPAPTRGEIAILEQLEDSSARTLGDELRAFLATDEVEATARRLRRLVSRGTFPQPDPDRPAIPWPPF